MIGNARLPNLYDFTILKLTIRGDSLAVDQDTVLAPQILNLPPAARIRRDPCVGPGDPRVRNS